MSGLIERIGRRWYVLLALTAAPVFAVLAPLLVGGEILAWGDDVRQAAPLYAFYARALHAGESILWNPDNFGGFPVFATAFGFFAPWNFIAAWLIASPLGALRVIPWFTFAAFAVGAFAVARLLMAFGVSFWAACLGAIAFTMARQPDNFYPVVNFAHSLLPVLFLCIWEAARTGRRRWAFGGALALGLGWLGANFQDVLYVLTVLLPFAIFSGVYQRRARPDFSGRRLAARLTFMVAAGTAIGLVQLLPTYLLAGFSTRSAGVAYRAAAEHALLPSDALRFVLPDFKLPLGIPFGSRGSFAPLYLGIVPLFAALYAMNDRRSLARFFTWLFWAIAAVAIVGSPVFWVMGRLPVFSYFRLPDHWLFVASFASAVLAGFGADRIGRRIQAGDVVSLWRWFYWFGAAVAAVLAGVITMNVIIHFFAEHVVTAAKAVFASTLYAWYQPSGAVPLEHYFGIIERYLPDLYQYVWLGEPMVLGAMLAVPIGLAVLFLVFTRPVLRPYAPAVLAAAALLNFLMVKSFDYTSVPASVAAGEPPTVRVLRGLPPGRVLPVLSEGYEERVVRRHYRPDRADILGYRLAMMLPNTNLLYGLPSAVLKDGLEPLAMTRLTTLIGGEPVVGVARAFTDDEEEAGRLLAERRGLLDFLGVRYLLSGFPLEGGGFPKIAAVAVGRSAIPVGIYENPTARPLAYLTRRISMVPGGDAAVFDTFVASEFQGVFLSCAEPCARAQEHFAGGTVTFSGQGNGRLDLKVAANGPAFLVVSQNHLPGWQASVDGLPARIETVNTVFIGLKIPAGEHSVSLRYRYPCFPAAALGCLVGRAR